MNRLSVRSKHRVAGFSSLAPIWFLVFAVVGGAFLCASYRGATGRPPTSESGIAATARPVVANSDSPATPHTKHIEDIKAGERVWAYDTSTGTWAAKAVLKPLVHDYQGDLVTISVGDCTIQCTGNHPFWVVSGKGLFDRPQAKDVYPEDRASAISLENGRWIEARQLEAGDSLVLRDGSLAPISEVQITATHQKVYNLQVADLHTYGVTDLGVAVHNKKNCFPAGTRVLMGDGSTKPIEEIQLGDEVLACDPLRSAPPTAHLVVGLIHDCAGSSVHVTLRSEGGEESVLTPTRYHRIWATDRGWVDAEQLRPGDFLSDNYGRSLLVLNATVEHVPSRTYNLSVADAHTFFALTTNSTPVLVHNQDISTSSRGDALNAARDAAGVPNSAQPYYQYTVGGDASRALSPNYYYSNNPAEWGRYYLYKTPNGSRVVADHVADPMRGPHMHAGKVPDDFQPGGEYDRVGPHHIDYPSGS